MNGHSGLGGIALAEAVREAYAEGQTDYSIEPLVLVDDQGRPEGRIQDGDSVVFCCRRGEREIQLTEAFVEAEFAHFSRRKLQGLAYVILTLYHEKFKDLPVAFLPTQIPDTLGEVVSRAGLRQLRASESEKFAHITFFFNGGSHERLKGEADWCTPSPKDTPYDQKPELSLPEVSQKVMAGIEKQFDLIVTNFANGDVIGHTAGREAKIQCAEFVDRYVGQVVEKALVSNYMVMITADHGNLEVMTNPDGSPHMAHTANLVPFILIDPRSPFSTRLREGGSLADIAPTILQALCLPQPAAMDGSSLTLDSGRQGSPCVLLVILDGWGIGKQDETNPIYLARTPVLDRLVQAYPNTRLRAAGEAVGLQPGKAGNSEAGHMNIGAGRMIEQDDVRLDKAMLDGSFYTNETLCRTIREVKQRGHALHLLCLLTEKSSHGCIEYPLALLRMAKTSQLEQVYLHVIFDGRSTQPGSAPALLEKLQRQVDEIGVGRIVTGMGRSFALDRDGNYDRTQKAYEALVSGLGNYVHRKEGV